MDQHEVFKGRLIHKLLRGDREAGAKLIFEERARLARIVQTCQEQIKACDLFVSDLGTTAEAAAAQVAYQETFETVPPIRESLADTPDKESRRAQVLALARKMAEETNENVSVYDLVKQAEDEGIELGVQRNRRETAVSNILRRSPYFRKVDVGLYECLTH